MNAPFEPAHSPFGGSVAPRIVRCPASVNLVAKVPAYLRKPSAYATRGSALHEATVLLLDENPPSPESLVNKTFSGYTITRDDVENAVRPAYACVEPLLNARGAAYYVERRVVFPTIAGAFGTVDLIVRIGNTIHVIDLKFGSGVRVLALYPDGDEDIINGQLLYYACAARHSLEFFVGVEKIILTIVQPQSIEPDAEMVSSVPVTHDDLDQFIAVFRAACEQALSPAPRLERGPHCRFCPARPICPAHTGPLLDLARFAAPTLRDTLVASLAAPPDRAAYLQVLAHGLALIDAIKDLSITLRDQAKAALENGDVVPGYTLTAGRAERHWRDDERTTIVALEGLGLTREDFITEELCSPKQIELRAKSRGLKVPPELIVSRRSGVSLVRSENAHAPVPGRGELVKSFTRALQALQGGGQS
jgi:hypothetical protein